VGKFLSLSHVMSPLYTAPSGSFRLLPAPSGSPVELAVGQLALLLLAVFLCAGRVIGQCKAGDEGTWCLF